MLTQLVTKIFTGEAGVFIARLRAMAVVYALMGVVALAMIGFLMNALFVWLASIYGAVAVSLGFAAGCLALIVLLFLALIVVRRPPRQRASDRLQRDIASVASVAAVSNVPLILAAVGRRKSLLLVPAIAAAGFAAFRLIASRRD